jgi:hypothetical protein
MSDQVPTGIERMPVELWHQIFQYFDFNGLCYSFRRLNTRIDAIIDQTPLHLNFRRRGAYRHYVKNIRLSMKPASVRSLSFQDSEEIRHFFSIHPLNSFVQLRSLYLNHMFSSDDPTFQFWNQLSSLKYLQSLIVKFWGPSRGSTTIDEKKFLVRSVFAGDFCPALQRFSVDTVGLQQGATNLQYLSIAHLAFDDLLLLLPAMENILSLCVDYQLDTDWKPIAKLPQIDQPLLPKCRQLELKLDNHLKFEHVEYLLAQTPNLKSLFIWGWSHLTDAKTWELLLSKYCPKLLKLRLICTGRICDERFDDAIDHFEQECRTNSFWLKRTVVTDDEDRSGHDYRDDFTVQFDIRKK